MIHFTRKSYPGRSLTSNVNIFWKTNVDEIVKQNLDKDWKAYNTLIDITPIDIFFFSIYGHKQRIEYCWMRKGYSETYVKRSNYVEP